MEKLIKRLLLNTKIQRLDEQLTDLEIAQDKMTAARMAVCEVGLDKYIDDLRKRRDTVFVELESEIMKVFSKVITEHLHYRE